MNVKDSSSHASTMRRVVDAVCMGVVALILVAQFMRPSLRDAAIFGGLLIGMLVGTCLRLPMPRLPLPASHVAVVAVESVGAVLLIGAGLALVLTPRFGVVDTVVVTGLGVIAGLFVWGRRDDLDTARNDVPAEQREPLHRAALAWTLLVILLGAWELVAFLSGHVPTAQPLPAISDLVNPLIDEPLTRAAVVVIWLVAGRGLARMAWRGGS